MLGNPKRVLLYFNRAKDTIGVRRAHERLAEAFPVRELGESFVIYIGTFCRHHGIRLTTTERFTHPEFTTEGLLTLNLSNTVTVSLGPRKRK